jgi:ATP-dependent RNA helicase DeaD
VKGAVDGAFGNSRTTRFFVNMGALDGFNINSLKDFLADAVKLQQRMVFNVDVKSSFSFFETESKLVDIFLALNSQDLEFNNRKIALEVSNRKMKEGGRSGDGERRGGGERRSGGGGRSFGGGGYKGGEKRSGGGGFREKREGGFGGGEKRDGKRPRKPGSSEGSGFNREKPFGGDGEKKKTFGKSRF